MRWVWSVVISGILWVMPYATKAIPRNEALYDSANIHLCESSAELGLPLYSLSHRTQASTLAFGTEILQPIDRNPVVIIGALAKYGPIYTTVVENF